MNGPRTVLRIPAYTTEGHEPMPQDIPDERWPATPTPTHQDDPARPSAGLSEGRTTISDEAMDTVARAIAREHGSDVFSPDHEPYEFTDAEREQYRAEAQAAVEAAAPHIAAQALRQAAQAASEAAERATERAKRDPHDGRPMHGYAGGLHAAAARLHQTADQLDGPS